MDFKTQSLFNHAITPVRDKIIQKSQYFKQLVKLPFSFLCKLIVRGETSKHRYDNEQK